MCGIWGYVGRSGTIATGDAWTGLCSLTHRGPDDWGMYFEGEGKVTDEGDLPDGDHRVAFGNRRLSIIDLSDAGNQPLRSGSDRWIVYNGEVYNYREIRADLEACGHVFDSATDTEVILRAYETYGESCVEQFRGMFAFVIYDSATDEVFAARDRFGIKPFYYDLNDHRFAFASEVTALLESGLTAETLDPVAVDGYLALGYVPGPRTIVEGVRELPPGSTLRYDPNSGEGEIRRFWQPSFEDGDAPTAGRVRDLLAESVALRLRSDVPVGAFLSGGLDSSSIVALMQEVAEPDGVGIHTFSIGFDRESFSETEFAETVAAAIGTQHTSETITADDVEAELDAVIAAMDQPTIDGVNTYFVSKAAGDAGLKVAMSGLGSDELFFGYPSFERVARWYTAAQLLYHVPRKVRAPLADLVEGFGSAISSGTAGKIADAIRGEHPFGAAYLTARGLFTRGQRRELLETTADWEARIEEVSSPTIADAGVVNAVSSTELGWYMRNQLLRDTDTMSMAHSLEVRVPFLDSNFSEYLMGASVESKRTGTKSLLKEAMQDSVPLDVIEREKSGFEFPFGEWLSDELSELVNRAFEKELLLATPLDTDSARAVKHSFRRGETHWSRLWALMVLILWIDAHLPTADRG